MQKGFAQILIILSIVLLLGVAGGVYYFGKTSVKVPVSKPQVLVSPTSRPTQVDETDDWKTYTNKAYFYEIKYPQNWVVGRSLYSENDSTIVINPDRIEQRAWDYITLGAGKGMTMEEATVELRKSKKILSERNFKLNDITGKKFEVPGVTVRGIKEVELDDNFPDSIRMFEHQGYLYILSCLKSEEDTCNQILSTFKFTQ